MDRTNAADESGSISPYSLPVFLGGEFLDDYKPFHSSFQIHHLILKRTGGTLWGCYQQALREIVARFRNLDSQIAAVADVRASSLTVLHSVNQRVAKRLQDESLRELALFIGYALIIKQEIGELSNERITEEETQLWLYRTRIAICRDLLAFGHPCAETVELIHVMPKSFRAELVAPLLCPQARDSLINWYLNHDFDFPLPPCNLVKALFENLRNQPQETGHLFNQFVGTQE
jgi:hypothetical protein